jgi:endonuclease IV
VRGGGSLSLLDILSLDFVIHAPCHGMNIASPFDAIRKASVEVMTDCFATAAEMGPAPAVPEIPA